MVIRPFLSHIPWRILGFGFVAIVLGLALGLAVTLLETPIYALVGIVGVGVVLVCLLNPEAGLLILVGLTYLRLSDVLVNFYGAPSIAKPFIAFLIGLVILRWLFYDAPPRNFITILLLTLAYGMVISLSLFYASDFEEVRGAIDDFWKNGIISILVVMFLRDRNSFRHVIWVLVLTGIFMGTISVWQYLTGTFTNQYWGFGIADVQNIAGASSGYRLAGQIGDPNFYAQIMLVIIPLAFNRFIDEKKPFLKGLALWSLVVTTLTVIFTFSRGAFLALIAMVLLTFYFHPPRLKNIAIYVVILLILVPFIPAEYSNRIFTFDAFFSNQSDVRSDASFRGRASEYTAAWMMFVDNPILGVGAENFNTSYQKYSRVIGLDPRAEARSAHSLYLEIAAELGIAGLIVFGIIIFIAYKSIADSWRKLRQVNDLNLSEMSLSFGIGLSGYLVASLFIHGSFSRYFWLLIGIAMALPEVVKQASPGNSEPRLDTGGQF